MIAAAAPRLDLGEAVSFTLAGHPQGKGRARSFLLRGHIRQYTPAATRSYESMIRGAATDAMAGRRPFEIAVFAEMIAVFDVPASYSGVKRAACLRGAIMPAKKPDLDNIWKTIVDACNGVVFKDDALVVETRCRKIYGPAPRVDVTVRPA